MRAFVRAHRACAWLAFLASTSSAAGARAETPEEQLAREVPEVRGVGGGVESPAKVAEGVVRALVERFEQAARGQRAPAPAPVAAPVELPADAEAPPPRPASVEPIYRYVDRGGRVVYTNIVESVPIAEREKGKLDLRRISVNTELGTELSARLRAEHAVRAQSTVCDQLRSELDLSPVQRLLQRHAPLVGGGVLLFAFMVYAPFVLKRFGVSLWMRMLVTILPLMAMFALGNHGLDQMKSGLAELKRKVEPCLTDAFARLEGQGAGLAEQADLVRSVVQLGAEGQAPATSEVTATGSGE